jgi:hypothetical protein
MIIDSIDIIKAIDRREREFTVWVGGVEVNEYYLTKENALNLADQFKEDGYDDVKIEEIK